MRVLEVGSSGPDVESWENFLLGLYPTCDLVVDGKFTDHEKKWTIQFQKDVGFAGLDVDGVVGRKTFARAMERGFDPVTDDANVTGTNWPVKPANISQLSYVDRLHRFGSFGYTHTPIASNPEAVSIDPMWVSKNIVQVNISSYVGLMGPRARGIKNVSCHKDAKDKFLALMEAWRTAGFLSDIVSFDGMWVPRFVRGSRKHLSNHAWGTAFDINAFANGLGIAPALKGDHGSVRHMVELAAKNGWFWGGWMSSRPDGQHFEIAA